MLLGHRSIGTIVTMQLWQGNIYTWVIIKVFGKLLENAIEVARSRLHFFF